MKLFHAQQMYYSFSAFVIEATRVALENLKEEDEQTP